MLHLQAMYVIWNQSSPACVSSSNSKSPSDFKRLYHFFYFCHLRILHFFHGFLSVYICILCNLFFKHLTKISNCLDMCVCFFFRILEYSLRTGPVFVVLNHACPWHCITKQCEVSHAFLLNFCSAPSTRWKKTLSSHNDRLSQQLHAFSRSNVSEHQLYIVCGNGTHYLALA